MLALMPATPAWLSPSLAECRNPVGVELSSVTLPRVARSSQPSALLRNPFGGCYEIQNTKCEKLGDSAVFQKLILGFLQTQDHLSGHQSGYQIQVAWFSSQCGCSKQSNGIGQQAHHPGQAQAVKKNLTESKLVFLIGLTGFDP